jgi:hypothetical protein
MKRCNFHKENMFGVGDGLSALPTSAAGGSDDRGFWRVTHPQPRSPALASVRDDVCMSQGRPAASRLLVAVLGFTGLVVSMVVLGTVFLLRQGLDRADKWASIISGYVAAVGEQAYRLRRPLRRWLTPEDRIERVQAAHYPCGVMRKLGLDALQQAR